MLHKHWLYEILHIHSSEFEPNILSQPAPTCPPIALLRVSSPVIAWLCFDMWHRWIVDLQLTQPWPALCFIALSYHPKSQHVLTIQAYQICNHSKSAVHLEYSLVSGLNIWPSSQMTVEVHEFYAEDIPNHNNLYSTLASTTGKCCKLSK
jgi:hypothetical protein